MTELLAIPHLHELNRVHTKLNCEKYTALKTEYKDAEAWWDGLDYTQKVEAGSFALHIHIITANYRWDCSSRKYESLSKSHRKRINTIFNERNKDYEMFDIKGMLGLR